VVALEGDITADGLGLSPADLARVRAEVNHVIHAAADIRFDQDIHSLLAHNYQVGQSFPAHMSVAGQTVFPVFVCLWTMLGVQCGADASPAF
jgi:hypothetical protein